MRPVQRIRFVLAILAATCAIPFALPSISHALPVSATGGEALRANTPSLVRKVFVVGKDDRRELPEKHSDLKYRIGFLYNSATNVACTASCVARDVILTAAHCVLAHKRAERRSTIRHMNFYIRSPDILDQLFEVPVNWPSDATPRNIVAGAPVTRPYRRKRFRQDWALAKLRIPACARGTLPLKQLSRTALKAAAKSGKILSVGYHGDRKFGEKLLITEKCRVKKLSGKRKRRLGPLIYHTCDLSKGASGSPLLMETASGMAIIGVNAGGIFHQRVKMHGKRVVKRYKSRPIHNVAVHTSQFSRYLEPMTTLRIVREDLELRRLQTTLKTRKLYAGKPDGIFGPGTWKAIRTFEKRNGKPVMGIPTKSLLADLGIDNSVSDEVWAEYLKKREQIRNGGAPVRGD